MTDYLNTRQVKEVWGTEFEKLAKNPKIRFTDTEILVDLSAPVETEDGKINQLRIKEPTGADMMAMDEGGDGKVASTMHLLASCAGVPMVSLRNMKAKDLNAAMQVVSAFL